MSLDSLATDDRVISNPAGYECFTNTLHRTLRHVFDQYERYTRSSDNSPFVYSDSYNAAYMSGLSFRAELVNQNLRSRFLDECFDPDFEYIDQPEGAHSRLVYSLVFDGDESNAVDDSVVDPVEPILPSIFGMSF